MLKRKTESRIWADHRKTERDGTDFGINLHSYKVKPPKITKRNVKTRKSISGFLCTTTHLALQLFYNLVSRKSLPSHNAYNLWKRKSPKMYSFEESNSGTLVVKPVSPKLEILLIHITYFQASISKFKFLWTSSFLLVILANKISLQSILRRVKNQSSDGGIKFIAKVLCWENGFHNGRIWVHGEMLNWKAAVLVFWSQGNNNSDALKAR